MIKPKCKILNFLNINEINIKETNVNNDNNNMGLKSLNILGKDANPNLDIDPYWALGFGDFLAQIIG